MNPLRNLPQTLNISLSQEVIAKFPDLKVACVLIAMPILGKKAQPKSSQTYLSDLKQQGVKNLNALDVTSDSYQQLRVCQTWRDVFASFGEIGGKQSTIENLLKRAAGETEKVRSGKKANMGDISNFVDAYNAVSVLTFTPMGANNIAQYRRDEAGHAHLCLRFAREGEKFIPLGKEAAEVELTPTSVVYADGQENDPESEVTTGFWNWKDAGKYAVPNASQIVDGQPVDEYILLVADQPVQDPEAADKPISERPGDAEEAIIRACHALQRLGATIGPMEILRANRPHVNLNVLEMVEKEGDLQEMCELTQKEST